MKPGTLFFVQKVELNFSFAIGSKIFNNDELSGYEQA